MRIVKRKSNRHTSDTDQPPSVPAKLVHDDEASPFATLSNVDRTSDQDQTRDQPNSEQEEEDEPEDVDTWCLICHSTPIVDRTVLPNCLHSQFCFECIVRWCTIKRRCPLCLAEIGDYVIHAIREDDDYLRYYLPPLPLTQALAGIGAPSTAALGVGGSRRGLVRQVQRARTQRRSSRAAGETDEEREREERRRLAKRKEIYRKGWYAKHVGSNRHTGYRPFPSPSEIRRSITTGSGETSPVESPLFSDGSFRYGPSWMSSF